MRYTRKVGEPRELIIRKLPGEEMSIQVGFYVDIHRKLGTANRTEEGDQTRWEWEDAPFTGTHVSEDLVVKYLQMAEHFYQRCLTEAVQQIMADMRRIAYSDESNVTITLYEPGFPRRHHVGFVEQQQPAWNQPPQKTVQ